MRQTHLPVERSGVWVGMNRHHPKAKRRIKHEVSGSPIDKTMRLVLSQVCNKGPRVGHDYVPSIGMIMVVETFLQLSVLDDHDDVHHKEKASLFAILVTRSARWSTKSTFSSSSFS